MADIEDVIVVGAGLAGLSAALELTELQRSFVVLEARDRAGGRVKTERAEYGFLDGGGEFIGLIQSYIPHYARRFALPTFRTFLPRTHYWRYQDGQGKITDFPGDNPLDFPGGKDALKVLGLLDEASLSVRANLEKPWETPLASVYDGMNAVQLVEFLWANDPDNNGQPISAEAKEVFTVAVRSAFSAEPEEISGLFCLYYAAAAGNFSTLVDINGSEGAAEGTRLTFGAGSLVDAFEDAVDRKNIQLRTTVKEITDFSRLHDKSDEELKELLGGGDPSELKKDFGWEAGLVKVTSENFEGKREVRYARSVIVAMSPPIAKNISYLPEVSENRRELMNKAFLGETMKAFLTYEKPFWREEVGALQHNSSLSALTQALGNQPKRYGLMGFALAGGEPGAGERFIDWTLDCVWEPPTDADILKLVGAPGEEFDQLKKEFESKAATVKHRYSLMVFIAGKAAKLLTKKEDAVYQELRRATSKEEREKLAKELSSVSAQMKKERKEIILKQLVEMFGDNAQKLLLKDAENYHEFNFGLEPLSDGGPTAVLPPAPNDEEQAAPQVQPAWYALRQPDGKIYWAGTEEATEWCGYMDGAIQSGIRAVGDLLQTLSTEQGEMAAERRIVRRA